MPIPWRVAKCLDQLLAQWNAAHPDRSKASDGSIGNEEHASRESDHNPWVDDPASTLNVVTARDFTHDPAHGADAGQLAEALKRHKDPRVKYVIWNWRIWSLARDAEGWRPYAGPNGHTKHCHVSCSYTKSLYDSTKPWQLDNDQEEDMPLTDADVEKVVDALLARKIGPSTVEDCLSRARALALRFGDAGDLNIQLDKIQAKP